MLCSGTLILLFCIQLYRELAAFLEEYGGIQWGWWLLDRYRIWFGLVATSVWLLVAAAFAFVHESRHKSD